MSETKLAPFADMIDVASCQFGTRVLAVSDEYFAEASNLFEPGRGVFIDGKYTDRGKWMDGWESRRKRTPGYDWCVMQLGVTATIRGFDIDTHFFNGNHPAFASVDGALLPAGANADDAADWQELLPQAPLQGDSQNVFAAATSSAVNTLRLNIFPDGGVARFRAYGRIVPSWQTAYDEPTRARVSPGAVDLAAALNGGRPLACSDARFSPMHHVLLPGRAVDMGGGWETRRRRGTPGHDWLIVELGARGTPQLIEVDTAHFKGNYPEACSIDSIDVQNDGPRSLRTTELITCEGWRQVVPRTELTADTRHFFAATPALPATHLRVNIYPDGGISRLRVWGNRQ